MLLIASHNLDELARLADRVAIIDHGRLQRLVDVRGAVEPDGGDRTPYRIALAGGPSSSPRCSRPREMGQGEYQLDGLTLDEVKRGLAALLARGALVTMVSPVHSMLEQQFREAVGSEAGDDVSRARVGAYALWQLRDYLKDRGLPTVIVATLAAYLSLSAIFASKEREKVMAILRARFVTAEAVHAAG